MSNTDDQENIYGPFNDLEEQQFKMLYSAYDVPLMDIRKKYFKLSLIVGITLLLLGFIMALIITIPNYIKTPIRIENMDKDMIKMFNHSVKVEKFIGLVGDTIDKDQPIVKINSPEIQNLVSDIKTAESRLNILNELDSLDVQIQINNLELEIDNMKDQLAVLYQERNAYKEWYISKKATLISALEYFEEYENANKILLEKEVITKFSYMKIKNDHTNKKDELSSLTVLK